MRARAISCRSGRAGTCGDQFRARTSATFDLPEWEARGAGNRNINIVLSDSSMHAHISEMPAGAYNKGHRHGPGVHVFAVIGAGYTLSGTRAIPISSATNGGTGSVFALARRHVASAFQHRAPSRLRYLAVSIGSDRYPVLSRKVKHRQCSMPTIQDGGLRSTTRIRTHVFTPCGQRRSPRPEPNPAWASISTKRVFASTVMNEAASQRLLDPYLDWTKREGIPFHEDFGVDLLTADTKPWPRLGDRCNGAFVHLLGRGDWMTVFLLEVPPGGKSAPRILMNVLHRADFLFDHPFGFPEREGCRASTAARAR